GHARVLGLAPENEAQCPAPARHQRPVLGSKLETSASCSNSSRSGSVSFFGTTILTIAYRSPDLPRGDGSPLPRNRSLRSLEEPAGIFTCVLPVSVGTSTEPPSA